MGNFYGGNGGTQLGTVTKDNEGYIYFTGMSSNNTTGIATPEHFNNREDILQMIYLLQSFRIVHPLV